MCLKLLASFDPGQPIVDVTGRSSRRAGEGAACLVQWRIAGCRPDEFLTRARECAGAVELNDCVRAHVQVAVGGEFQVCFADGRVDWLMGSDTKALRGTDEANLEHDCLWRAELDRSAACSRLLKSLSDFFHQVAAHDLIGRRELRDLERHVRGRLFAGGARRGR